MIERFNFYDLYGYVVPGLALLGMLWLPLWWLAGRKVPGAWFAAVVALVLAYIAGHVVARFGQATLRYFVFDAQSRRFRSVQPSNLLLSAEDVLLPPESRLPPTVKSALIAAMQRRFGIDNVPTGFFLFRRALLRERVGSYAEQFEGIYTMMRGLAAVSVVAMFYYAGWAMADLLVSPRFVDSAPYAAVVALAAIAAATLFDWSMVLTWSLGIVAVLSFPIGLYLGAVLATAALSSDAIHLLWILAAAAFYLATRFYQGYRYFAVQFATTVYRDFYVLERLGPVQDR